MKKFSSSKLIFHNIRFSDLVDRDTASCDLLIVLGTSLMVAPICMIPGEHNQVSFACSQFRFSNRA